MDQRTKPWIEPRELGPIRVNVEPRWITDKSMNKKATITYLIIVLLVTALVPLPLFLIQEEWGTFLLLPISMPLVLTYDIEPISLSLAAMFGFYFVLNILIFIPILCSKKFNRMRTMVITQFVILALYFGVNLPFFGTIWGWVSIWAMQYRKLPLNQRRLRSLILWVRSA